MGAGDGVEVGVSVGVVVAVGVVVGADVCVGTGVAVAVPVAACATCSVCLVRVATMPATNAKATSVTIKTRTAQVLAGFVVS